MNTHPRGGVFIVYLILMLAVSLTLFGQVTPAQALATYAFTVNDAGDAGDANKGNGTCATSAGKCTVRAAIEEVNALKVSGQETVSTITIPQMTIAINNELVLTTYPRDTINIQGAGDGITIIDGQGKTRGFSFYVQLDRVNQTRSGRINVSNLTVRNANSTNYSQGYRPGLGGAFFIDDHVNLTNVSVYGSFAKQGGGIFIDNQGTGNPAQFKYHPVVTLNNVNVIGNTSTSTTFGDGGGGIFSGGELTGSQVSVNSNLAYRQGGGVYVNSWYLNKLTNFNVNGNASEGTAGGFHVDVGRLELYDGVINGNQTRYLKGLYDTDYASGAGVVVNGYQEPGFPIPSLHAQRVLFSNNVVLQLGGAGGGLLSGGIVTLQDVSFINNQASYGAGIYTGIYAHSRLDAKNIVIGGNTGRSGASLNSEGGGLMANAGIVNITNGTISGNVADVAGGITNRLTLPNIPAASVTLTNSILRGNNAIWRPFDCLGSPTSGNNNILGDVSYVNGPLICSMVSQNKDLVNVDPMLGMLTGFPAYYPLRLGSPAINAGNSATCTPKDIRGVTRPQGSACDIGAYEMGAHKLFAPQLMR